MTTNETESVRPEFRPVAGWDFAPGPPDATTLVSGPQKPHWSRGKTIAAVVVAVGIAAAAGVTVAVVDKTSTTTATAGQGAGGPFGAGGGRGFAGGPGGPGGALMSALHGTVVVNNNGTYLTEAIQTGQVTAVSATSITVASADGFTKSYTLGSSTVVDNGSDKISSVANGHTVSITATVSGDAATVTQLSDQTLTGGQQGGVGPGAAQGGIGPGAAQGGVGPGAAQGGTTTN